MSDTLTPEGAADDTAAPASTDGNTTPAPAPADDAKKNVPTKYVVLLGTLPEKPTKADLANLDKLDYKVHSTQETGGANDAKREAVKGDKDLEKLVEAGRAVLVPVPLRSWRPKVAGLKQRDPVLEV